MFLFSVETLPLSIDDCPRNVTVFLLDLLLNKTSTSMFLNETSITSITSTVTNNGEDYFYLYRISYAWYTFTGKNIFHKFF